jgi:hypothetical protein
MRFGIFYEHQLPRPWQPGDEQRLLTDALEQIELADRLGIDYLWLVEHTCDAWPRSASTSASTCQALCPPPVDLAPSINDQNPLWSMALRALPIQG